MKQRPRIYYTERQKAQMWERWQKGESLSQIAQLFDRGHSKLMLSSSMAIPTESRKYGPS